MQLHTPALPGIDEIELTSITLEDQVHDPMDECVVTTAPKDDQGAGMSLPDHGNFDLQPQTFEDIVGLSQELIATPPGTPHTNSRSMRPQTHMHYSVSHNRSVSVPPSEHRAALPRATQTQPMKSRPLRSPPRSLSLMDLLPVQQPAEVLPLQSQEYNASTSYPADSWRPQGDMYDLPFLDLHYYSSMNNNAPNGLQVDPNSNANFSRHNADLARRGQALDLADSVASTSKALGLPPSLTQHFPMVSQSLSSTPSAPTRILPMHHRGQSAVSPQDLLLRKGNDNKRKRSSWDGGLH